jgi:hypothetical protein
MRQEKWDEFHKKLDEALDSEFGKAKVALREYLLENKEQVAADLEEMREKSNNTKETLEEAAIKYAFFTETNGVNVNQRKKQHFTAGAKWMQEQMERLKDFEVWKEWKNTNEIK